MNADELIEHINARQEELTKENKNYFEDILIYVRLSFDKSEQETEEVLAEILDHILLAQDEGRRAVDVFGVNPKAYLHDIVGELPKMVTKKGTGFVTMILLYFLASVLTFHSLLNMGIYYIFDTGELSETYHIGSIVVIGVLSFLAVFVLLYGSIHLLRWVCFRNIPKWREFLLYWLYGVAGFGLFLAIFFFVPTFGLIIDVPLYVMLILGIVLYGAGRFMRKRL